MEGGRREEMEGEEIRGEEREGTPKVGSHALPMFEILKRTLVAELI